MATTVKSGSKGTDVKNLQTQLNSLGYNLAVDGVFGKNTLAAVKDYQGKNGLTVDGIVGKNTWNSLLGASSNNVAANTNTAATGVTQQTGPTAQAPANSTSTTTTTIKSYNEPYQGITEYTPSANVSAAFEKLQQAELSKPGAYESQYKENLDNIMNGIINREPFKYDLNGDMLYQQYKDQYTQLGQQAMRDTMGNAAALTGGYGNSYASTAGNQAYQGYLQQLNDRIPELYDRARNNYDRDLQWDLQAYELMSDRENQDYNRYRDTLSDYYNDLNLANDRYLNERNFDYNRFADDRNFGYDTWLNNRNFEYQQERDNVSDAQWQKAFDEDLRRYNQEWDYQLQQDALAAAAAKSDGSGSSARRKSGNPTPTDNSQSEKNNVLEYARAAYALYGDNAVAEIDKYAQSKGVVLSDADLAQIEKDVKLKQAQPSPKKTNNNTVVLGGAAGPNLRSRTVTKK